MEIGQRNHLSHYDIQKLLITYNCNAYNINNEHKRKEQHLEDTKIEENKTETNETEANQTEVNPQKPTFNIHNTITNQLGHKCSDSKTTDESDQVDSSKTTYPNQFNIPVPPSLALPHLHFYFHFDKK